jgi:hypothetical protein
VDEGSQATVAGVRDTIEVIKSVLDEYADTPGPPPPPPSGTVVGIAPDTPDRAPAASPPATSPEEAT